MAVADQNAAYCNAVIPQSTFYPILNYLVDTDVIEMRACNKWNKVLMLVAPESIQLVGKVGLSDDLAVTDFTCKLVRYCVRHAEIPNHQIDAYISIFDKLGSVANMKVYVHDINSIALYTHVGEFYYTREEIDGKAKHKYIMISGCAELATIEVEFSVMTFSFDLEIVGGKLKALIISFGIQLALTTHRDLIIDIDHPRSYALTYVYKEAYDVTSPVDADYEGRPISRANLDFRDVLTAVSNVLVRGYSQCRNQKVYTFIVLRMDNRDVADKHEPVLSVNFNVFTGYMELVDTSGAILYTTTSLMMFHDLKLVDKDGDRIGLVNKRQFIFGDFLESFERNTRHPNRVMHVPKGTAACVTLFNRNKAAVCSLQTSKMDGTMAVDIPKDLLSSEKALIIAYAVKRAILFNKLHERVWTPSFDVVTSYTTDDATLIANLNYQVPRSELHFSEVVPNVSITDGIAVRASGYDSIAKKYLLDVVVGSNHGQYEAFPIAIAVKVHGYGRAKIIDRFGHIMYRLDNIRGDNLMNMTANDGTVVGSFVDNHIIDGTGSTIATAQFDQRTANWDRSELEDTMTIYSLSALRKFWLCRRASCIYITPTNYARKQPTNPIEYILTIGLALRFFFNTYELHKCPIPQIEYYYGKIVLEQ